MTDPLYFTRARLRTGRGGSSLAAFLAASSGRIGRGHHLLWSLFGDHGRDRPFVYRNLGASALDGYLLYSTTPPQDQHNLWELDVRTFDLPDQLQAGDRILWSIRVNPVLKNQGKKHNVALRAWREWCNANPAAAPEDRPTVEDFARKTVPAWLAPRLDRHGLQAKPDEMRLEAHRRERFLKSPDEEDQSRPVVVWTADVSGIGQVTQPAALRDALRNGIGPGGAYGCGMLLLKRG